MTVVTYALTPFTRNMRLRFIKFGYKVKLWLLAVVLTLMVYNTIYITFFDTAHLKLEFQPNNTKYILQWTSPKNIPFIYMGVGRQNFIDRKCRFTNCYVTSDRSFLGNVSKFDAIVFAGPEVVFYSKSMMPSTRSPHQKYVFASIESAANYPLCSNRFDNYFNWTWTYKLNSDSRWGYIVVRDTNGNVIGPNENMHWIKSENMLPVTEELKAVLRGKTKAVAWFVSNCVSKSDRELFAQKLKRELKKKYNLQIDIYGKCGKRQCRKHDACDEIIRRDYFFYLSFENSFSEDYVTEKLLHAVEYNAVPIVYGGANYSRFLPEGSYLNALELGPEGLAAEINISMHDLELYSQYFKWTNHYSYKKKGWNPDTDDYCGFCTILNDEAKVKKITVYEDFQKWWDTSKYSECPEF